ncbi:MAG TPA: hypothetical protein VGF17_07320, partial [Phytomonospora sp.]
LVGDAHETWIWCIDLRSRTGGRSPVRVHVPTDALAWSGDGLRLALSDEGPVRIWNTATGAEAHVRP